MFHGAASVSPHSQPISPPPHASAHLIHEHLPAASVSASETRHFEDRRRNGDQNPVLSRPNYYIITSFLETVLMISSKVISDALSTGETKKILLIIAT